MAVRWPLPPEHRFGRARGNSYVHIGLESLSDAMWLRLWQGRVRYHPEADRVEASGIMDGPTQRIAISLQHEAGLPETGMIDEETWYLAWH